MLRRLRESIRYNKAWGNVKMLKDINLDSKDIQLITNLYWDQKAAIQIENEKNKLGKNKAWSQARMCSVNRHLLIVQPKHNEGTGRPGKN